MKFVDDFESFLRTEVNLDSDRLDTLEMRVAEIENFVSGHATFEALFLETIPTGSWAHRTIIRPVRANDEFDGDVLVHLNEASEWLPKDYIDQLYAAFQGSSTYRPLAERKTRCVRINYKGDFHADVVPYLERSDRHWITNRAEPKDHGRYEASNPEAFTVWIDERQRVTSGTFIKVVRLVKYLRDFKNSFTCKSIILTTLLGSEVNEIQASNYPEKYGDVPSTLVTLFQRLAQSLPSEMPAVMDPAGTGDNFTDRYGAEWNYANFRSCIIAYSNKITRAFEETDRESSVSLWREVFGVRFKPGSVAKVASLVRLSAAVPQSGESFIDKPPNNYPMQLAPQWKVRIAGRCTGFRSGQTRLRNGFRQFILATHGNRVPKNRSIQFDASVIGPSGYRLFWKVRNGGQEAANVNQLRGEIAPDAGNNQKIETTMYKGTHYVECYVVANGRVVARDHQTVIVT
jgi:hypothetical protein